MGPVLGPNYGCGINMSWRNSDRDVAKMAASQSAQVVLVGQTPPPYGGQAILIQAILQGLQQALSVVHVRMGFSDSMGHIARFRLRKLGHLVGVIGRTVGALRKNRHAILYYPPAGAEWMAVFRDLVILMVTRPFAHRTLLHFHTSGVAAFVAVRPWLRGLARLAYGRAHLCIIQNELSRRDAEYFDAREVTLLPCGLDVPIIRDRKGPVTPFRILYVGTHSARKGIRDLVETADHLRNLGADFMVHCVGEWYSEEDRSWCETRVRQCRLEDRVVWRGNLVGDEKWREYDEASLFFFPTAHPGETFGLVLLEAMAYGLPIVASRWPGPKDVVEHEVTGLLCPPGDTESYAAAILRLMRNAEVRQCMGSKGRDRYLAQYTFDQYMNSFTAAIKGLE